MIASALPNPVLSGGAGYAITYANNAFSRSQCLQNGAQCSSWTNNIGLNDSAALETILSGKRDLRLKVARNALAAAKLSRVDAERTIAFQVKATYLQVAEAVLGYEFARQVAAANTVTLRKFQARYSKGAINEGDLERIETQKLESDQTLDAAVQALRVARVALAFLLGVRGQAPEFAVDTHVLDFSVLSSVQNASEVGLLRNAFALRPDSASLGFQRTAAEAQIELTQRLKFPDIDSRSDLLLRWIRRPVDQRAGGARGSGLYPVLPLSRPLPVRRRAQAGARATRCRGLAGGEANLPGGERRGHQPGGSS